MPGNVTATHHLDRAFPALGFASTAKKEKQSRKRGADLMRLRAAITLQFVAELIRNVH
jgi:hypothetical protein